MIANLPESSYFMTEERLIQQQKDSVSFAFSEKGWGKTGKGAAQTGK
ncbi:MAG: hypothetical protein IKC65_03690 [Lentisphaeria bacterium]|nr:hypothetical protein [Lentisphaeria bacterium]